MILEVYALNPTYTTNPVMSVSIGDSFLPNEFYIVE